jgi:hypothetical protein
MNFGAPPQRPAARQPLPANSRPLASGTASRTCLHAPRTGAASLSGSRPRRLRGPLRLLPRRDGPVLVVSPEPSVRSRQAALHRLVSSLYSVGPCTASSGPVPRRKSPGPTFWSVSLRPQCRQQAIPGRSGPAPRHAIVGASTMRASRTVGHWLGWADGGR